MKTYSDIKIGDTVYIWGEGDASVEKTIVVEKEEKDDYWNLKFKNGCEGCALKNGTSSSMGMYARRVYSDKEAVRKAINKHIKLLNKII